MEKVSHHILLNKIVDNGGKILFGYSFQDWKLFCVLSYIKYLINKCVCRWIIGDYNTSFINRNFSSGLKFGIPEGFV